MAAPLLQTVLLLLPCLHAVTAGLRITKVEVPRYLIVGKQATLRCHLALEGDVLYSLKWWKDGKQFYQYIPQNDPPNVVFTVPGITINPKHAELNEVELVDVQTSSTGQYKCEVVAEGPTFNTDTMTANMTILDTPDEPPRISGLEGTYREGETITLNCTSSRSRPPATLTWSINGRQVGPEHLVTYPVHSEGSPQLHTTTLGLTLTTRPSLFASGALDLRCSATLHDYVWRSDATVTLENVTYSQPHHLPTLSKTNSSGGVELCLSLLLLTMLLLTLTSAAAFDPRVT
ncbi:cell adhesion molecule 3-like [Eriocheir sinensis]|uniref:cell adhesion molecule 3-like n=1 Tax=Eriocheir sinensis TaxID=95602 RepID=UPI0021C9D04F|nr:cell adhesion molecule 3-like [Eriocheir sinensis]